MRPNCGLELMYKKKVSAILELSSKYGFKEWLCPFMEMIKEMLVYNAINIRRIWGTSTPIPPLMERTKWCHGPLTLPIYSGLQSVTNQFMVIWLQNEAEHVHSQGGNENNNQKNTFYIFHDLFYLTDIVHVNWHKIHKNTIPLCIITLFLTHPFIFSLISLFYFNTTLFLLSTFRGLSFYRNNAPTLFFFIS